MKLRRFVTFTVGVLVLSAGLFLITESAGAAPKDKSGGNPTQNSWDENLPSASRFTVLSAFGNEAVLDKNTGLVWEQAPDATFRPFSTATTYCLEKPVGGTRGWRLPSVAELVSLIDPSLPAPFVPASVFTNVRSDNEAVSYWSATTFADVPSNPMTVHFFSGNVSTAIFSTISRLSWCVRGPM